MSCSVLFCVTNDTVARPKPTPAAVRLSKLHVRLCSSVEFPQPKAGFDVGESWLMLTQEGRLIGKLISPVG